jgi:Tfp pilus assembly protein PilX
MILSRISRIKDEDRGWVLVIAMVVMVLMLGIGLAALSLTDTQSQSSRKEREREATINLAEGALYTQSFILALPPSCTTGPCEGWPGSFERRYLGCTQATGGLQCPNDATLANVANTASAPASFKNVDTNFSDTVWTTTLADNGAKDNNDYATRTLPEVAWDQNGDSKIWVRATARLHGHKIGRTVVGLMQIENIPVNFPRTAITAGSFTLSQKGNQTYIDTGSTTVQLRCTPLTSTACANYDTSKPEEVTGAPGSIVGAPSGTVLTTALKNSLRQKAIDLGRYYPENPAMTCPGVRNASGCCPTGAQMQAATIYVENCNFTYGSNDIGPTDANGVSTTCTYSIRGYTPVSNQRCIHGPNRTPFGGTIVWERGTLGFSAGVAFFGVIYHLNLNKCGGDKTDDVSDPPGNCTYDANNQSILVTTSGGGSVIGSINVDGAGAVEAGNNKSNIVYDPAVFNDQSSFGTTGLVQNTWRELDPGQ